MCVACDAASKEIESGRFKRKLPSGTLHNFTCVNLLVMLNPSAVQVLMVCVLLVMLQVILSDDESWVVIIIYIVRLVNH